MNDADGHENSLKLPESLGEQAARFLAQRAANTKPGDLQRYLDRAPDVPPLRGDELPDAPS